MFKSDLIILFFANRTVRNIYMAVTWKMIAKFPPDDKTLTSMVLLNPEYRTPIATDFGRFELYYHCCCNVER